MKVSLHEIANIFDSLIKGELSREDASDWARKRQDAEDAGDLEYEPESKEREIWDSILYLEGVDLKDGPDSYLHVLDDFESYRSKLSV
jgi:hypothetical protein